MKSKPLENRFNSSRLLKSFPILSIIAILASPAYAEEKKNHCSELVPEVNPFSSTTSGRVQFKFNGCWYGGVGFGLSTLDPSYSSNGWASDSSGSSGLSLSFGRQLTSSWFVEGHFSDLGASSFENRSNSLTNLYPDAEIGYTMYGVFGGYYINALKYSNLKPYLRSGISSVSATASGFGDTVRIESGSTTQLSFGVGVDWRARYSPWTFRVGYNRYAENVQVFGGNVFYYVGGKKKKQNTIDLFK